MKQLTMPGGQKIAWSTKEWALTIVPRDSQKKRALRIFIQSGFSSLVARPFDFEIKVACKQFTLGSILSAFSCVSDTFEVLAFYSAPRRSPPRSYLWITVGGLPYFIKIGEVGDVARFSNELTISSKVLRAPGVTIPNALEVRRSLGWSAIAFEGLSLDVLRNRKPISAREMLSILRKRGDASADIFGGVIHNDLGPHNLFSYSGEIFVVDWEFSSLSGPKYSNVVNLALLANPYSRNSISELQRVLLEALELDMSEQEIRSCLMHLRANGLKIAGAALSSNVE